VYAAPATARFTPARSIRPWRSSRRYASPIRIANAPRPAARTAEELRVLRADLPQVPPSAAARRAELVSRRRELRRELVQQTVGGLVPFFVCVAIWLASGASGSFWPAWVALVALIPLLRNGWRLYGPSPELERVEAELRRSRERRLS